jgi:superoxide dismutase, Fe-Mn family
MAFTLPKLPYAMDALKPHISAETLEFHYGKHHQAYVNNLNNLTEGKPQSNMSLEEIIKKSSGGLFNNAAQVYNHAFYWNCLAPNGGGDAKGPAGDAIKKAFGDFNSFKEKFTNAAVTLFGSGWAWLVKNGDGSIAIEQTPNAGCPVTKDQLPLLTCDVWEHAYYIDYRNLRPKYVEAFWNLVNWDFVNQNLK